MIWLAALAAMPAASGAAARLIPIAPGEGAGPVITSSGATFWLAAGDDGVDRLMRVAPDADAATEVARLPARASHSGDQTLDQFSLDASDDRWVIGRLVQRCVDSCSTLARDDVLAEQFSGAPGAPVVRTAGCGAGADEPGCTPANAACLTGILTGRVDGRNLATQVSDAPSCSTPPPVTIDAPPAAPTVLNLTGGLEDLAGRFALVAGAVYDWSTPSAPPVSRTPGPVPVAASIDDAGTLFFTDATHLFAVEPGGATRTVARLHTLRDVAAVAAGRVLLASDVTSARVVSLDDGAGTNVRRAADVKAWSFPPFPAFNGSLIAYLAEHCAAVVLVIQGLADTIPGTCPLPVASHTLRLVGTGSTFRLRCASVTLGCAGHYRFVARRAGHTIRRFGDYAVAAGDADKLYDVFTARELRRFSHGRVTVTLTPQTEPGAAPTVAPRTLRVEVRVAPQPVSTGRAGSAVHAFIDPS